MTDEQVEPAEVARIDGEEMKSQPGPEPTFTQADVDKLITERLKREREKFRDYDDLKAQAKGKQSADERIAALEAEVESSRRETLRRRVQAAHGLSDEDADLFLVGADEETLMAQAKRLVERGAESRKAGGVAPLEGATTVAPNDDRIEFANFLTRN